MGVQQLPQFNTAGNMNTVLHAALANVILTGPQLMFESAISGFPAGWVAPLPGVLFSISGAQKNAASATTLSLVAYINNQATSFASDPVAFTGGIQTFSKVASSSNPVTFNAGDIITVFATPSNTLATGTYASVALAVLM